MHPVLSHSRFPAVCVYLGFLFSLHQARAQYHQTDDSNSIPIEACEKILELLKHMRLLPDTYRQQITHNLVRAQIGHFSL